MMDNNIETNKDVDNFIDKHDLSKTLSIIINSINKVTDHEGIILSINYFAGYKYIAVTVDTGLSGSDAVDLEHKIFEQFYNTVDYVKASKFTIFVE